MPSEPELQHSTLPGQEPATAPASDMAQSPEQDALLSGGTTQQNTITGVRWNSSSAAEATFLSGSLTVAVALSAPFTYFVLNGLVFNIGSLPSATTVNFHYNGTQSAQAIKNMAVAGAQLVFGK